ncbi:hypothetical protein JCM21714_4393 [Gracilibacillus boraciitolerans JCM 21714]|uniref:Uncharacterized protein n=1 Tax=Gracilibacillus boraciitolerans JCM 21714 TaxID=1298598 RepID=W4VQQ9_9BACI|nr:hypothetical protein [Gracilibacillus boraciitolerans]GAE95179.1 hypothetical protein JCM21714_4393 [Gracilibacillus boraciitolerans JCM 21714]
MIDVITAPACPLRFPGGAWVAGAAAQQENNFKIIARIMSHNLLSVPLKKSEL